MLDKLLFHPLTYFALVLIGGYIGGLMYPGALPARARRVFPILLLAGTGLLAYVVFKPAEPEPPPQLLTGRFSVPAFEAGGTPFKNYMKFPIKVEFTAEGQWSLSQYPDSIRGPEGQPRAEPDTRYRLASAPEGSLILQRADTGEYETVGRQKVIELQPGERVLFMINDFKHERAYADNTGTLDVAWTCFNCLNR